MHTELSIGKVQKFMKKQTFVLASANVFRPVRA
jgi:hypothetical protein